MEDSAGTPGARHFRPAGLSLLFVFLHGELINVSIFYQPPRTREHKGNRDVGTNVHVYAFPFPPPILTSLSWAYFPCRFFHIVLPFAGYSLWLLVFLTALFSVCTKPVSPDLDSSGNLVELAASAYLLFRRSVGGLHVSDFIK